MDRSSGCSVLCRIMPLKQAFHIYTGTTIQSVPRLLELHVCYPCLTNSANQRVVRAEKYKVYLDRTQHGEGVWPVPHCLRKDCLPDTEVNCWIVTSSEEQSKAFPYEPPLYWRYVIHLPRGRYIFFTFKLARKDSECCSRVVFVQFHPMGEFEPSVDRIHVWKLVV